MGIEFLLLIAALVLFLCAAVGLPTARVNLGWLGLAVLTLIYILQGTARL